MGVTILVHVAATIGDEGDPTYIEQCIRARQANPRAVPGTSSYAGGLAAGNGAIISIGY